MKLLRTVQLKRREEETTALIDEILDSSREIFERAQLPEWLSMDSSKLIVSGHSFGGITAIMAAAGKDTKVKACLTFDPWLYVHHGDIIQGGLKLKVPLLAVNSEYFHTICTFDIWSSMEALFINCQSKLSEAQKIINFYHSEQSDYQLLMPFETSLQSKRRLEPTAIYKYFMQTQMWLEYLDRIGFNNKTFDGAIVRQRCKDFSKNVLKD